MEVLVEISEADADKLNINSSKLSFEELRKKIALAELDEALDRSHEAAKMYGLDEWSIDEVNNLVAEAKDHYNDKSRH